MMRQRSRTGRSDWYSSLLQVLLIVIALLFAGFSTELVYLVAHDWRNYSADEETRQVTREEVPVTRADSRGFPLSAVTSPGGEKTTTVTTTSNKPNSKELFGLAATFVLLLGFVITAMQLRMSQVQAKEAQDQAVEAEIWRRNEFVAEQLRMFHKDRSVVNVVRMWESLGQEYDVRLLLDVVDPEAPHSDKTGKLERAEVAVTKQDILNAFTPDGEPFLDLEAPDDRALPNKVKHTPLDNKIAYEVDEYFKYLMHFRKFVNDGILKIEDIHPYLYWHIDLFYPGEDELNGTLQPDGNVRKFKLVRQLRRYIDAYYGVGTECPEYNMVAFIGRVLERPCPGDKLGDPPAPPGFQALRSPLAAPTPLLNPPSAAAVVSTAAEISAGIPADATVVPRMGDSGAPAPPPNRHRGRRRT